MKYKIGKSAFLTICCLISFLSAEIRLIHEDSNTVVDSITLEACQKATYSVQRKNSSGTWEDFFVCWTVPSTIQKCMSVTQPQTYGTSLVVYSNCAGEGTITVTSGFDTTLFMVIPVKISGPEIAENISFTLLTDPSHIVAGDTIVGVLKVSDSGGLKQYVCVRDISYSLNYHIRPEPVLIVNGQVRQFFVPFDECVENGVDTIKLIIYYAPYHAESNPYRLSIAVSYVDIICDTFVVNPGQAVAVQPEAHSNGSGIGCGTGAALAIIPPFIIRGVTRRRGRKKV